MAVDGLYEGISDEVVLVVSGIHESEQSGVEVACWVRALLDELEKSGKKPAKTVKVIPDIDESGRGRSARLLYRDLAKKGPPKQENVVKSKFREVMDPKILAQKSPPSVDSAKGQAQVILKPNRMFPAPGFPRQWLGIEPGRLLDEYIKILELEKLALRILISGAGVLDWAFSKTPGVSLVYTPGGTLSKLGRSKPASASPSPPTPDLLRGKDEIRGFFPITNLLDTIEALRPIRRVSCHGMVLKDAKEKVDVGGVEKEVDTYDRTTDDSFPGIFVDPRYSISGVELEEFVEGLLKVVVRDRDGREKSPRKKRVTNSLDPLKFDADWPGSARTLDGKKDDDLALRAAQHVFDNKANASKKAVGRENPVAGNWLDPSLKVNPVVHYHFDAGTSNPTKERKSPRRSSFRATGFSLGDWGPVSVLRSGTFSNTPSVRGIRDGAPVFTVEPANYYPSGAFDLDLVQLVDKEGKLTAEGTARSWDVKMTDLNRAIEMRTFAEAIIEVICETKL